MPLDPAFLEDCPYAPGGLLLGEVLEVDAAQGRIRVRWPTHDDLPITREQRTDPVRHPRHVSGGLMVRVTGMVGYAHAYYLLGLRHAAGWIGYGVRIHSARFHALAPPGEPIDIECTATQLRRGTDRILGRYRFAFTQSGKLVYEGDQTALWLRVRGAPPAAP
ncbi:MAG TPA: hotdog fold domain-containing protein [Myxococcota bacterium]|jgi:hypothetical protein|nr:hotdog fold domain-containing protein [Myxococcota bacterium]